jgi:hypothetical protein
MILGRFSHDPGSGLAGILATMSAPEVLSVCCLHLSDLLYRASREGGEVEWLVASRTLPCCRLIIDLVGANKGRDWHESSFPQARADC